MDRRTLIEARAQALDLAPRRRPCRYCRLEYRHTGGITTARGWFCSRDCARARGRTREMRAAELLVAMVAKPPGAAGGGTASRRSA